MGYYCASPVDPSDRHPPLPTHRKNKSNPFSIKSNGGIGGAGGSLTVLNSPTGRDILAPCDLGDELGRSRFGVTYLCTDKSTDDQFACKLFRYWEQSVMESNDSVMGHIISTIIGANNGEPKRTISYMAERIVGTGHSKLSSRLNAWRRETVAIKKMLHDKRYKNRELCV